MAMSATISVSPSSVRINQPSTATVVISNSGGSAVNVLSCQLKAFLTGNSQALDKTSFAPGVAPLSAGFPVSVAASGTLTLRIPLVFFQSSRSTTFDVSANIISSDGANFSPSTPATITVIEIPGIPSTYAGPT